MGPAGACPRHAEHRACERAGYASLMQALDVLRTLLLYHLVELLQGGHATRIVVRLDAELGIVTCDDGRGMGIDRSLGGRPYLDLVLGQLDLLDGDEDLQPEHLQLHAVGISLMARECRSLRVTIDRAGERREGSWSADSARWEWRASEPISTHGTCFAAMPRAGLPDASAARTLVESLEARCGRPGAIQLTQGT